MLPDAWTYDCSPSLWLPGCLPSVSLRLLAVPKDPSHWTQPTPTQQEGPLHLIAPAETLFPSQFTSACPGGLSLGLWTRFIHAKYYSLNIVLKPSVLSQSTRVSTDAHGKPRALCFPAEEGGPSHYSMCLWPWLRVGMIGPASQGGWGSRIREGVHRAGNSARHEGEEAVGVLTCCI